MLKKSVILTILLFLIVGYVFAKSKEYILGKTLYTVRLKSETERFAWVIENRQNNKDPNEEEERSKGSFCMVNEKDKDYLDCKNIETVCTIDSCVTKTQNFKKRKQIL